MSILIDSVSKHFVGFRALNNVSLEIPTGGLVALLGPSGCGKTTLLRIVAGLDRADHGRILFDGDDVTRVPARARRVGFVFQHYALFKHMTIYDNIAFGLSVQPRSQRPSAAEINSKVCQLLELVRLEGLAQRYPAQLSGGQRQRIALARALAVNPKVLLLDEPFGALDSRVRKELRRWLRQLHDELHVTSIFVTHDQEEALEVADTVVVMNNGHLEQVGTPEEIYEAPATPFVYRFLGDVNTFSGRLRASAGELGGTQFVLDDSAQAADRPATLYARPHEMRVARRIDRPEDGIETRLRGQRRIGAVVRLDLERLDGHGFVEVEMSREQYLAERWTNGEVLWVRPQNPRTFLETVH